MLALCLIIYINAFGNLLCSTLCQHNRPGPTGEHQKCQKWPHQNFLLCCTPQSSWILNIWSMKRTVPLTTSEVILNIVNALKVNNTLALL